MVIRPHRVVVNFDETMTVILGRFNFVESLAHDNRPSHLLAAYGQGDIAVLVTSHPSTPDLRLITMNFRFVEFEYTCAGIEEVQCDILFRLLAGEFHGFQRRGVESRRTVSTHPSLRDLR